jgi:hypothetical protein
MPNSFQGYEIVSSTNNFLVTCEDDFFARNQALAISYICESDLTRLEPLFSTEFQAAKTIDHGVWVNILKADPGRTWNGVNYGYETEQSSRIVVGRNFQPPEPAPPSTPADPPLDAGPNLNRAVMEFPQRVFVAELVEIMMDFTGYGWNPRASNGEALSGIMGALLHPYGYYDTQQGPRVNQWLNGGRPDFIGTTEDTDGNFVSFGCGILFINYLVHQLGFELRDVVRAGGDTLAETYHRLTGKAASSAFSTFRALIDAHADPAKPTFAALDNVFPLYDAPRRSVSISPGTPVQQSGQSDPVPQIFTIKPGFFCPEKPYAFTENRQIVEVPNYARARGLLNAGFAWQAEGVNLSTRGRWTDFTLNTPVTIRNPDKSITRVANSTKISYFIRDSWNASELFLKNKTMDGNVSITVGVFSAELTINNDPQINTKEPCGVDAVWWTAGPELAKDRKTCNPSYSEIDKSLWNLTATLAVVKNRPDPPPERSLKQVIDAVTVVLKAAGNYAKGAQLDTAEVIGQLAVPGTLRSQHEPLADTSLRSIQPPETTAYTSKRPPVPEQPFIASTKKR